MAGLIRVMETVRLVDWHKPAVDQKMAYLAGKECRAAALAPLAELRDRPVVVDCIVGEVGRVRSGVNGSGAPLIAWERLERMEVSTGGVAAGEAWPRGRGV